MSLDLYVKAEGSIQIELLEEFKIPTAHIIYRGSEVENGVAKKFIETIEELAKNINKFLKANVPIIMTNEKKAGHQLATSCDLCRNGFLTKNYKVANHDHLIGQIRQTLCNIYKLKLQTPTLIPCFHHNLSIHYTHFIVTVPSAWV